MHIKRNHMANQCHKLWNIELINFKRNHIPVLTERRCSTSFLNNEPYGVIIISDPQCRSVKMFPFLF